MTTLTFPARDPRCPHCVQTPDPSSFPAEEATIVRRDYCGKLSPRAEWIDRRTKPEDELTAANDRLA